MGISEPKDYVSFVVSSIIKKAASKGR